MGCGTPQEKIEDQMMAYKLERMDVQMQKEKELKKLAEIEGHVIERGHVPDYIDPEFAKKNKLYPEQNNKEQNQDQNQDQNKDKGNKDNKRDAETEHSKKKRKLSKKNTEEMSEKKKKKKK